MRISILTPNYATVFFAYFQAHPTLTIGAMQPAAASCQKCAAISLPFFSVFFMQQPPQYFRQYKATYKNDSRGSLLAGLALILVTALDHFGADILPLLVLCTTVLLQTTSTTNQVVRANASC
ncbi:hypothetical protein [uncultured Hymenobacter sp.]|uniref:hypothetical protein n=1 Tax=uncultured Hymenobacter sp. TaxID=170016 RepID=UPI0035CC1D7C